MDRVLFRSWPVFIALGVAGVCFSVSSCAKAPPKASGDASIDAVAVDVAIPLVTDALGPPVVMAVDGSFAEAGFIGDAGPALIMGSEAESRLTSSACNAWSRAASDAGAGAADAGAGGSDTGSWSKHLTGGVLLDLSVDGQGRVALASVAQEQVDFGSGPIGIPTGSQCLVLSSFTGGGAHRWSRSLSQYRARMSAWPDGGLAVLLNGPLASFTSDGNVRWVRFLDPQLVTQGHSFRAQTDGSVWVVMQSGSNFPDPAIWQTLVRLSATGEILSRFALRDDDRQSFVSLSATGDIFVVHNVDTNNQDFSVSKIGPNGQTIWFKAFSTTRFERCDAAVATNDGGVVIIGQSSGDFDLGGGPLRPGVPSISFASKLDAGGRHVASHSFSSGWHGAHLLTRPSGGVLLAGDFSGSLNLDGITVHTGAPGDKDFLLVELGAALQVTRHWHYGNGGGNQLLSGIAVDPDGAMLLLGSFEGKLDLGSGVMRAVGWSNSFLAKVQP